MQTTHRVLAINPGSTSTKIACFDGEQCILDRAVAHPIDRLSAFRSIMDQRALRRAALMEALDEADIAPASLSAVVGRGGVIHPVAGGTYRVNQRMLRDLEVGVGGEHASNLGGILAREVADLAQRDGGREIPAFIVDPVVVDELVDEARPSGIPEIERSSIFHALNQRAVARRAAGDLGRSYASLHLVVAHMGGGITVGAHRAGRVIEVNDGLNGEGPFTPERSGTVAALKLIDLCFSGAFDREAIKRRVKGGGGLAAYLGTADAREIGRRIDAGDAYAETIYRAMAWQVAREIGAAAASLGRRPNAIVLTGGLAHDERLVAWIRRRVEWISRVIIYPGEREMIALAEGALRVLRGEEAALEYRGDADSDAAEHVTPRGTG